MMRLITLFLSLGFVFPTLAAWQLDDQQSRISFISIKKTDIAEVHRFAQIKGSLDKQAKVRVTIDLASVMTQIAIRDQRMKTFLFETNLFPQADFSAQLDQQKLQQIKAGESMIMTVNGLISLHGQQQQVNVEVLVARLNANKLIVSSFQPLIINASTFGLVKGIKKLQALAKLPSISKAVPLSFVLTFIDQ